MKITIIHGGTSTEAVYSTQNATSVYEALLRLGHEATMLHYDKSIFVELEKNKPDLVFLCVQGTGHGDGTLQGILDFMGIPYTGTGMQQAAIINDKVICQAVFEDVGIPIAKHFSISQSEYESLEGPQLLENRMNEKGIDYPIVAKAISQGACLGIRYIRNLEDYDKIKESFLLDVDNDNQRILVEEFIQGISLTVPLLARDDGWQALSFIQGVLLKEPDSAGKTIFDASEEETVLSFSPEIDERIKKNAIKAANVLGARDYCRVDFIYNPEHDKEYLLEINAVPGLREESYFPLSAAASNITFDDIINRIVVSAIKRIIKNKDKS